MIGYPSLSDIPALKTMWELCFPKDTIQFIDFYFEKVFKENQSLALWKNDMFVAFMQILPYQIKIGDKIYNAGYISGAMTHPEHRQKGYMQQLLNAAFEEMKKQGFAFSFLIPQEKWLFDFYSKCGYEKAFSIKTEAVNLTSINIEPQNVEVFSNFENLPLEKIFDLYITFLNQKENVVLKTKEQLKLILEDLFIDESEGHFFYCKNSGFALALKDENRIFIKEMFYLNEESKASLLAAIKRKFNQDKAIIITQSAQSSDFSGMIKTLDYAGKTIIPANIYMNMMLD